MFARSNFWDVSDQYVAATTVVGAACGMEITDPLALYKQRCGAERPLNPDGTLRFTAADIDLEALNRNQALLATAWRTLAPLDGWGDIPNALRGIDQALRVHYRRTPPGLATLGVGPIKMSQLAADDDGGRYLRVGGHLGFRLDQDGGGCEVTGIVVAGEAGARAQHEDNDGSDDDRGSSGSGSGRGSGLCAVDEIGAPFRSLDDFSAEFIGGGGSCGEAPQETGELALAGATEGGEPEPEA